MAVNLTTSSGPLQILHLNLLLILLKLGSLLFLDSLTHNLTHYSYHPLSLKQVVVVLAHLS
jgi:hypothetical protein